MRVNIEEEELSGSRLRKMAHLLERDESLFDARRMAIGYLVDLWHQAVNSGKRQLTKSEIMDYLFIYDDKIGEKVVNLLETSGYLVKNDDENTYFVEGKEKDFIARESYVARGRAGGEQKWKNKRSSSRIAGAKQHASSRIAHAKLQPSTSLAGASMDASNRLATGYPNQIRSDQINSDQCNTNIDPDLFVTENGLQKSTTEIGHQIPDGKPEIVAIAPVEESRSAAFRRQWFEMYAEAMNGATPPWGRRENAVVKELLSTYSLDDLKSMVSVYFRFKPSNCLTHGYPLVGHSSSFKWSAQQLYADIKNPSRRLSLKNNEKELKEELKIRERVSMVTQKENT